MATKKVRVEVTERDIKQGKHIPWCCPIALGVKRAVRPLGFGCYETSVRAFGLRGGIQVANTKDSFIFLSCGYPKKVAKWVDRYDAGKKVHPFSFTLEVPCPASK